MPTRRNRTSSWTSSSRAFSSTWQATISLDDAAALALMKAHLDRDARMNALRQKWLGEFQKVLPGKLAARAMQIDRRLSLVGSARARLEDSPGSLRRLATGLRMICLSGCVRLLRQSGVRSRCQGSSRLQCFAL